MERPQFNNWKYASEFEWSCCYLWSRAPLIPGSFNLNGGEIGPNPLYTINYAELSCKIPEKRRGKYAACPYCSLSAEPCHFNDKHCAYSASTKYRCYPLAGFHACNGHGSKCLLNRGKKTSLERLFTTKQGINYPNLRYLEHKCRKHVPKLEEMLLFNEIPDDLSYEWYLDLMAIKGLNIKLLDHHVFMEKVYYRTWNVQQYILDTCLSRYIENSLRLVR